MLGAIAVALLVAAACSRTSRRSADTSRLSSSIAISSSGFGSGDTIPAVFTCDGANHSPPLSWTNLPPRTASLTVIVDDPDAPGGTFVHWIVFNIPGGTTAIAEAQPHGATLPQLGSAMQGLNDFHAAGYDGPCPPRGPAHRYRFWLFALDTTLSVAPGATRARVEAAMRGHELAYGELIGRYARR
jgi:Raf kinase inhibitor-like YbhB/YbcL family protein